MGLVSFAVSVALDVLDSTVRCKHARGIIGGAANLLSNTSDCLRNRVKFVGELGQVVGALAQGLDLLL